MKMFYVKRKDGVVAAISRWPQKPDQERLVADDPEVLAYLNSSKPESPLKRVVDAMDAALSGDMTLMNALKTELEA